MKSHFLKSFKKSYKKRIQSNPSLDQQFQARYFMFTNNSSHPILKDHPLKGKKQGLRAFSITGDIRVIYYVHGEIAYFLDVGTHNQVY